MTWKEKTCERCVFQVDNECRRIPPTITVKLTTAYPTVRAYDQYKPACAEYAELLPVVKDKP